MQCEVKERMGSYPCHLCRYERKRERDREHVGEDVTKTRLIRCLREILSKVKKVAEDRRRGRTERLLNFQYGCLRLHWFFASLYNLAVELHIRCAYDDSLKQQELLLTLLCAH